MWKSVLALVLGCVHTVAAYDISMLAGNWSQVVSNYYVQSTTEVDWKCVTVHVDVQDPASIAVAKTAFLHSPKYGRLYTTPTQIYSMTEDTLVTRVPGESLRRSRSYLIRSASADLVVLTGIEDPAVYVWSKKSWHSYYTEDHLKILADLARWEYTSIDKMPLNSFSANCPSR